MAELKRFKVALCRTYVCSIRARDEKQARRLCELFLEFPKDCSSPSEREERGFDGLVVKEAPINDAYDANEVAEDENQSA